MKLVNFAKDLYEEVFENAPDVQKFCGDMFLTGATLGIGAAAAAVAFKATGNQELVARAAETGLGSSVIMALSMLTDVYTSNPFKLKKNTLAKNSEPFTKEN